MGTEIAVVCLMSGIFGIIHLDHSPALEAELHAMRSAMQEWGPDGGGLWRGGPAGLGSHVLFDTPEAVHEKLPLQSAQGFVLTAEARLDNRPELCDELRISAVERETLADGALILRAYEQWGEDAAGRLIGDWSFAAWHPAEERLFLARDHFGNTGLYYYQDARRFAFASSRKALFALGLPRRLDEFFLACVLVSWSAHQGSRTIEQDLHRLPPAHTLRLQGGMAQVHQYWRLEDMPELRLQTSQDYIDGLLSIYDRAVRDRLRSTKGVAVTLSGGLDSGSTTALAARALRERNLRLRAYTSVPIQAVDHLDDERILGDEWMLAQATAAHAGNVDLIAVGARDVSPIQGIRRTLAIHDEPGHAASNFFWIRSLLDTARREGISTLLTGQGGNATISWTGIDRKRIVDRLLRTRSWKRLLQTIVYPLLPRNVLTGMRLALHRGGLDWGRTSINEEFARRLDLSSEFIRHSGDSTRPERWYPPLPLRWATIRPGASFVGSIWAESGASHGLEMRDATFDKRVMEFALAIPDREYIGPDGTDRWVIRAAMQGLLPDEVRLNRRLGLQAADVGRRMIDSAAEVEQALDEIDASELCRQYLAVPRLHATWESLQKEITPQTTHLTITVLTRGIMAGLHLAGRERAG